MKTFEVKKFTTVVYTVIVDAGDKDIAVDLADDLIADNSHRVHEYIQTDFFEVNEAKNNE